MSDILSGDKLCFAEEQFSSEELELLKALAESLGATVVTVPDSDSIIITQPHSSSYSDPDAPSASYHWLGACAAEKERVDPDELDPPFFVSKPTEDSPDSRPLRFWVSINVKRDRAEPAEVAQAGIHAKLRRHGGLIVSKRSQADVLVVNRETEFYRTVKKEIAAKGRHWQTTAEKEWVDACVAHRELLSATDVDLGLKQRSLSVESVTSEDDVRIGRGPGRPVGKPRNEYTPKDDDFLCRFLAAYYPHGSHGSRKTYQDLVSKQDAEVFTTAAHHTAQSWHERFKKNKAIMSRRITRLQAEGIGLDLKTDTERKRDKETKRRLAEQKMLAQTGSSSQASPNAKRRAFVELDDSDDDVLQTKRPKSTIQPSTQSTLGRGRVVALGARPSLSHAGPSQQPRKSVTPELRRSASPAAPPATTAQAVEESIAGEEQEQPAPAAGQPDTEESTQDSAFSRANVSADVDLPPSQENGGTEDAEPPQELDTQPPDATSALTRVEAVETEAADHTHVAGRDPGDAEDNAGAQPAERVTDPVSQTPHIPRTAPASRPHSPAIVQSSPDHDKPEASDPPRLRHSAHSTPRTSTPASRNGSRHESPATALTPSQRVARGAALITSAREAFKRNIMNYSEKYGCTPTELYSIVNGLGGKGKDKGGQLYWDDVEKGLRDKFGY